MYTRINSYIASVRYIFGKPLVFHVFSCRYDFIALSANPLSSTVVDTFFCQYYKTLLMGMVCTVHIIIIVLNTDGALSRYYKFKD